MNNNLPLRVIFPARKNQIILNTIKRMDIKEKRILRMGEKALKEFNVLVNGINKTIKVGQYMLTDNKGDRYICSANVFKEMYNKI